MREPAIDPADHPGTEEYEEIRRDRYIRTQAYLGNWENIEDLIEDDECLLGSSTAETRTTTSASIRHKPKTTTRRYATSIKTGSGSFTCSTGNGKIHAS